MSAFSGPNTVKSGMVFQLDFSNTRSYSGTGTLAYDLSGGGNTSTLVNSPTFSGGLLSFNGSSSYINVPFNVSTFPTGTGARTLMAFFKTTTVKGQEILGIGGNTVDGSRLGLYLTSGGVMGFECRNAGLFTTASYSTNTWYHLAVAMPASASVSGVTLYVNGVAATSALSGSNLSINTTSSACVIGTIPGATSAEMFAGNIAVPTIYNRALTASEVNQTFQALRGRYGI